MTYAAVIVVYWAIPQDVLGGEATARGELLALRHHLFPVAAYALGRLAAFAWEERGRIGGLIAMSAVIVAVVGLADLAFISLQAWRDSGGPGLVPRAARPQVPRPLRVARELGLQHGRRGQPDPAARLDVPLAARQRVRARRRSDLRRQPAVSVVVGAPGAAALRRAALHAHAGCARCARVRSRRARPRATPDRAGRARRCLRRGRRALPLRLSVDRAVDELHAGGARVAPRRTRSSTATRAGIRSRATSPRRRATGGTCATGFVS